jgi:chemotaxis-related protein WspD
VVDDCWNRIGVRGDRSCPQLEGHIHCRNCPVFSAGAVALLDGELTAEHLAERTSHVAQPAPADAVRQRSVVIFRVASEWLSLPTSVVAEVGDLLPIHSLPHRRDGVVLGLASVRGRLLVCVSLGWIVGVDLLATASRARRSTEYPRLLVIRNDAVRVVCPVDEVHGIHHFHPRELTGLPATVARAAVTYSTALLPWRGHSVAVLDEELVFHTLTRSLA